MNKKDLNELVEDIQSANFLLDFAESHMNTEGREGVKILYKVIDRLLNEVPEYLEYKERIKKEYEEEIQKKREEVDKKFERLVKKVTKKKQGDEYTIDLYLLDVGVMLEKNDPDYEEYGEKYGENFCVFICRDEAEKYLNKYVLEGVESTYGHLYEVKNVTLTKGEMLDIWCGGYDDYEISDGILIQAIRKENGETIDETTIVFNKQKKTEEEEEEFI